MTKLELLRVVAAAHPDLALSHVQALVEAVFDGVADGLGTAGRRSLHGLGVFVVERRPQRPARNPRTGAPVVAGPSVSVRLTVAPGFEPVLAGSAPAPEPEPADPVVAFVWRATGERHPRKLIGQVVAEVVGALGQALREEGGRLAWPGFGSFKRRPGGRVGFTAAAGLKARLMG